MLTTTMSALKVAGDTTVLLIKTAAPVVGNAAVYAGTVAAATYALYKYLESGLDEKFAEWTGQPNGKADAAKAQEESAVVKAAQDKILKELKALIQAEIERQIKAGELTRPPKVNGKGADGEHKAAPETKTEAKSEPAKHVEPEPAA